MNKRYIMKCLLLIALILPFSLGAQQNGFTGIGPFKVGVATTSTIQQFATENKSDIKPGASFSAMYKSESRDFDKTLIYLLAKEQEQDKDIMDIPDTHYIDLPTVKTYKITRGEIASVPVEDLYLSFYKDTLYKITTESLTLELHDAINLKYGEGITSKLTKKISCRSGLGVTYQQEEVDFISKWKTGNANIEASTIVGDYYNDKCEKETISDLTIVNTKIDKLVDKLANASKQVKETKEQVDKKSKLKDF